MKEGDKTDIFKPLPSHDFRVSQEGRKELITRFKKLLFRVYFYLSSNLTKDSLEVWQQSFADNIKANFN